MVWDIVTSIASVVSMVAFVLTALFIRADLRAAEKDRYIAATNQLFAIWQSTDFMKDQMWVLHQLAETKWSTFITAHRGEHGEIAFHRVGSFYDRVGTLTRLGLVNEKEILSTIGGYAIGVWQKIEPIVREARSSEHSNLFDDYEKLLPACYESYVPLLGASTKVRPFSLPEPVVPRISPLELHKRLDRGDALYVADVRRVDQIQASPEGVPGAHHLPPDELAVRLSEILPSQEIVAYCDWPDEASSARVALILLQNGHTATALEGGLDAWISAALPTEPVVLVSADR